MDYDRRCNINLLCLITLVNDRKSTLLLGNKDGSLDLELSPSWIGPCGDILE
jgi:hypothetical protein